MSEPMLVMNPFVDIHIHPQPEALPIDTAQIEVITVRCPVRGRGLVVRELTAAGAPALFAFFANLVARGGELALDSDAPLVDTLVNIGFLISDSDIVEWPAFAIPLADAPEAALPDARWVVADSLVFQPAFALHPGVRWAADYDEQDGRLRCFGPGPALWVGAPGELVTPRWLRDDDAALVAGLVPGASPPPLPPALGRALAAAGALVPVEPRGAPLDRFTRHRAAFAADEHTIIRDLLGPGELAALRRYYAALLAAGLVPFGDRQNRARYSAYNDPIGRFLHTRLAPAFSALAGRPLVPSFTYFFSYLEGADLAPHKDREQAEYSISLQIDHTPTPAPGQATGWPLVFSFDDGRTASADLAIGDAVLYHGRSVTHARGVLPADQRSSLLVLEYVPHDFAGLRI